MNLSEKEKITLELDTTEAKVFILFLTDQRRQISSEIELLNNLITDPPQLTDSEDKPPSKEELTEMIEFNRSLATIADKFGDYLKSIIYPDMDIIEDEPGEIVPLIRPFTNETE